MRSYEVPYQLCCEQGTSAMIKYFGPCLVALMLASGLGCASDAVSIEVQEQSLSDIKKTVYSLMGEPRLISENQREFTSKYYSRKSDSSFDPFKAKERLYSIITILGPRRPYNVEFKIMIERRSGKTYVEVGEDTLLSEKLARDFREKLAQSRDGRIMVDEFRAF